MKIQYNSPVILSYTFACTLVLVVDTQTHNQIMPWFTVFPSMDTTQTVDYFRLFSHVLGHSDWQHLLGNFTFIVLLGPILEEKYGSQNLLLMLLITALVTGLINVIFFSTGLLGASSIVFMLILLSSVTNSEKGGIPLTFILVVVIFLGKEAFNMFENDNISQSAHIIGGVIGSIFGFKMKKKQATTQLPTPADEPDGLQV